MLKPLKISYSTNFKSANREFFWTMVGTQNRKTKKNSLFVCFAVLEVNQLFYHGTYLDEHILSFSNFRSTISFSNCPYFLFSLSPRLSQFICLESFFLLLSPLENKIIKLSILMFSLSLSLSSYSFQETCNI